MKTERIYNTDPYIKTFEATVCSCEKKGDLYEIVLDKTAFYPEGGGQPSDVGTLNDGLILNVQEHGDEIVHFCDRPFVCGEKAIGVLDWERRFSLMQQHSGEHIVSGIVHQRFGYDNIGFHMGADAISVDFNGLLTKEEVLSVEQEANMVIWSNIEVTVSYPDAEGLKSLNYRSKKEISGQIRIVSIPNIDTCACCGTHVKHTGEIGIIKLLSCNKAHSGTRIEMVCGKQALQYIEAVDEQNHLNGVLLSAKPLETANAVQKLYDERNEAVFQISQIEKRLFDTIAKTADGKENCLIIEDRLSSNGVRGLVDATMKHCYGTCAVFSGNDEIGYKYAIGGQNIDLREFGKILNKSLQGRGGGKENFIQGSVEAKRHEIEEFFSQHWLRCQNLNPVSILF